MDEGRVELIAKAHREEGEIECRWCFAVDLQRVKAIIVDQEHLPDATVLSLWCPRCGGVSSYYIRAWGEDYFKERIITLYPDFEEKITDELVREVNDRLWPEFYDEC